MRGLAIKENELSKKIGGDVGARSLQLQGFLFSILTGLLTEKCGRSLLLSLAKLTPSSRWRVLCRAV